MEGDSVELTLTLSRPLPTSLTVQLEYVGTSAKVSKLLVIIYTTVYAYHIKVLNCKYVAMIVLNSTDQ